MDQVKRVLVAGASGYLGSHVVRALRARGHHVRALTRRSRNLGDLRPLCDEVFVGEATKLETLKGVCDGISVVYSSIGKRDFRRRPSLWDVEYRANRNLVDRALESGVEHFVFVSALHADSLARLGIEGAVARESVAEELRRSGLAWTILRPTGAFNDMAEMFRMCAKGTGWVLGDGRMRINPIHGADLADEVVRAIEDPSRRGRSLDLGGPEVFTHREILELAFRALGKGPRIRSIPTWLLWTTAPLAGVINPMLGSLLSAMYYATKMDMVGHATGRRRLEDFFLELATQLHAGEIRDLVTGH